MPLILLLAEVFLIRVSILASNVTLSMFLGRLLTIYQLTYLYTSSSC